MTQFAPSSGEARIHSSDLLQLKSYLMTSLVNEIGSKISEPDQYRLAFENALTTIYNQLNLQLPNHIRIQLFQEIVNELAGFGPLQPLLEDPTISEVMVNGPGIVFIERNGEIFEAGISFDDADHLQRVINRMIYPLGRRSRC